MPVHGVIGGKGKGGVGHRVCYVYIAHISASQALFYASQFLERFHTAALRCSVQSVR